MECPHRTDAVSGAIRRCPFLGQLAADNGEAYARAFALNPGRPAAARGPIFPESLGDLAASFKLFHGAGGIVPLTRAAPPAAAATEAAGVGGGVCPAEATKRIETERPAERRHAACPLSAAPLASISSGVFKFLVRSHSRAQPGPDDFIARLRQRRKDRDRARDARRPRPDKPTARARPRARPQQHRLERWRSHPVVGGLIPLSAAGDLACPPLVVAGRQAVARLKAVRQLRPRALPVKLLGVGGHCLAANVPAGAAREHTRKFSPAWFLAVHATVPFFAFVRKGVGMPPWALLLTVACAVAGQALGAAAERRRLAWVAARAGPGGGGGGAPLRCAPAGLRLGALPGNVSVAA